MLIPSVLRGNQPMQNEDNFRPMTARELKRHPEFPHANFHLTPTKSGKAIVGRRRRGGPLKIYWELHGFGPHKLVFIIGLGLMLSAWQRQTKYFGHERASEFTCLLFDNRGMGKSDKSLTNFSVHTMAIDAVELLNQLGWTHSHELNIIGVSMGGMIAQDIALLIPNRINSLAFVSTGRQMINAEGMYETFQRRAVLFLPRSLDAHIAVLKSNLYTDSWLRAQDEVAPVVQPFPTNGDRFGASEVHKKTNHQLFTKSGFIIQALATQMHHRSEQELKEIADRVGRSRILVVHGAQDQMVHLAHGVCLAKGLGLISKLDEGQDWSARQDGNGWGWWGNWKVNRDEVTNEEYMVKFVQGQSHAVIVEKQDDFHRWLEQVVTHEERRKKRAEEEA